MYYGIENLITRQVKYLYIKGNISYVIGYMIASLYYGTGEYHCVVWILRGIIL